MAALRVEDLSARLRSLPGMGALLEASEGLPALYLVGGAVRDLLRGAEPVDLDLAVDGDAAAAAQVLAERLGGEVVAYGRFGTAQLRSRPVSADLAGLRRERYGHPGALPEVEPAGLDEDLARRDFTINAMAVALSGERTGQLHDPHGGRRDLDARAIRVLHDASFADDPTRLLRAVRYASRLGAALEPHTRALADAAAASGALGEVSGARVRDELLDLLAEPEAPESVGLLAELGIARSLHPRLRADPELVAGAALACAETGAQPALAGLAALCSSAPGELSGFVEDLGLPGAERDAVLRAAARGEALADSLRAELRPSELHALLSPEPPEALALALALGAPGDPVLRYIGELRGARLEVTGDDLVAAGVPASPAIGRALEETLRRKLDGELSGSDDELSGSGGELLGRDAELRTALELARGRA